MVLKCARWDGLTPVCRAGTRSLVLVSARVLTSKRPYLHILGWEYKWYQDHALLMRDQTPGLLLSKEELLPLS